MIKKPMTLIKYVSILSLTILSLNTYCFASYVFLQGLTNSELYFYNTENPTKNETITYQENTHEVTVYEKIYFCTTNPCNDTHTEINGIIKKKNNFYTYFEITNESRYIMGDPRFIINDNTYTHFYYDDPEDTVLKIAADNDIPTYNMSRPLSVAKLNSTNEIIYEFTMDFIESRDSGGGSLPYYSFPFSLTVVADSKTQYKYTGIFTGTEENDELILSSDIELNSNNETATFTWDMENSCISITRNLDNSTIIDGCSSN
tara:strand:- start:426 stop:1205 length:780 start_codon:yes stop_codon:yes gene_type:complete